MVDKPTLFERAAETAGSLVGGTKDQRETIFDFGRPVRGAIRGLARAVEDQLSDPAIRKPRYEPEEYVEGAIYGLRKSGESSTLKAGAEAKAAAKVFAQKYPEELPLVNLTLGQPNANPPKSYVENVITRIRDVKNWGYTPVGGDPKILSDIIAFMQKKLGYPEKIFIGEKEVPIGASILSGAKSVLTAAMQAVVPDGKTDMVFVTFKSKWVSYSAQIENAGGHEISIDGPPDESEMTEEQLNEAVEKLKALVAKHPDLCLIINYPKNPTGEVNNRFLREVAKIVLENPRAKVIQDSIYFEDIHEGGQPSELLEVIEPRISGRVLTVFGFAKSGANAPGERSAWGTGNKAWTEEMDKSTSHLHGNPSITLQLFTGEGVKPLTEECVRDLEELHNQQIATYTANQPILRESFLAMGIQCPDPKAAFYLHVDFAEWLKIGLETQDGNTIKNSEDVRLLLLENGVATTPGEDFDGKKTTLRLSYATDTDNVKLAANRIKKTLGALKVKEKNMTVDQWLSHQVGNPNSGVSMA
jgi:aspartate/methionine/tyrosine aminotransferase